MLINWESFSIIFGLVIIVQRIEICLRGKYIMFVLRCNINQIRAYLCKRVTEYAFLLGLSRAGERKSYNILRTKSRPPPQTASLKTDQSKEPKRSPATAADNQTARQNVIANLDIQTAYHQSKPLKSNSKGVRMTHMEPKNAGLQ